MPSIIRCSNCRFWDTQYHDRSNDSMHDDDKMGICKRFPPVRDMDWSSHHHDDEHWIEASDEDWRAWQQPCTTGGNWCGEYIATVESSD